MKSVEIRSGHIVEHYWWEIVAMANELLKRKRLTEPDALVVLYATVRSQAARSR